MQILLDPRSRQDASDRTRMAKQLRMHAFLDTAEYPTVKDFLVSLKHLPGVQYVEGTYSNLLLRIRMGKLPVLFLQTWIKERKASNDFLNFFSDFAIA